MAESTKEKIALDVEIASPEFFDHTFWKTQKKRKKKIKKLNVYKI